MDPPQSIASKLPSHISVILRAILLFNTNIYNTNAIVWIDVC